jgi:hypothetical protein
MGRGTVLGLAVLAALATLSASGQVVRGVLLSAASVAGTASGEVVRAIDDPHTGDHWLLLRDAARRGGPGRLLLASGSALRQGGPAAGQPLPGWVIRTGDRLILEENTAVAEARLEAVALGPAPRGFPLRVRLKIGGTVVRAVALGPGRAAFAPETEARP